MLAQSRRPFGVQEICQMDVNLCLSPEVRQRTTWRVSSGCETKYPSLPLPPVKISRSMEGSRHFPARWFPRRPCRLHPPSPGCVCIPTSSRTLEGKGPRSAQPRLVPRAPCRGTGRPSAGEAHGHTAGNSPCSGQAVGGRDVDVQGGPCREGPLLLTAWLLS